MESWAASILARMARMEESLQSIHAECRLLRGELTGAVRASEEGDGIVEEKSTREIVEKIAWDVEKIKDKIFSSNIIEPNCSEETANDPEVVVEDCDLNMDEEDVIQIQQLSLPRLRANTDKEEREWLDGEWQEIADRINRLTVFKKIEYFKSIPYAFIRLDNLSSCTLLNLNITVLGGRHTLAYSKPLETGESGYFTINQIHNNPGEVQFVVSILMDETDDKLCITGRYKHPKAFASMAIVQTSVQIPSQDYAIPAFINEVASQDDSRNDIFHSSPVPVDYSGQGISWTKTVQQMTADGVVSGRSMVARCRLKVIDTNNGLHQRLQFEIKILELPETPSLVQSSLCRHLKTPFTFPNLETVRKTDLLAASKIGNLACQNVCIVDLTNLGGVTLHKLQEKFADSTLRNAAPVFTDPLKPMSRILTLFPAFKESPNYIAYHVDGTDLALMVYWNMHENSSCFALAFVPEKLVMTPKLRQTMLKRDEFGHCPNRDFACGGRAENFYYSMQKPICVGQYDSREEF